MALGAFCASGYQAGYKAGLAAARRQLANQKTENDAPSQSAIDNTVDETAATSASDLPAIAEPVSLSVRRAGKPPSLRGTMESLQRQNARLDAEGLERIEDELDLTGRIAHKLLVPVPVSAALTVNPNLPPHRRYCRPWTARFLADLARAHVTAFHRPLQVSSAVRTVQYQKRLITTNGNAAPAEGDVVSPHMTGAAVDIAKDDFSRQELSWMRQRLLDLQQAGKIDVEEEFQQSCFHITVYKSYAPPAAPHKATRAKAVQRPSLGDSSSHRKPSPPETELPAARDTAERPVAGL